MKRVVLISVLFIMSLMITACENSRVEQATTEAVNEIRYKVDYCGRKDSFLGAKDSYRPGDKVSLFYSIIATDTDYSFYLDGESLNYDYDAEKGFIITFTMPDHDVKLEVDSRNTMMAIDNTTGDTTEGETEDKTEEGGSDSGTKASSDECPFKVEYYDDVSIDESNVEYWTLFNDTYSTRVVITTDVGLPDFGILALTMQDVDAEGNATYEYKVLEKDPYLNKERTLLVTLTFYGDTPNIGITYRDPKTAEENIYALYQSGKDGSLCLENITGYANKKVSYLEADILEEYSRLLMNYKDSPDAARMEYVTVDINKDGILEMLIYLDGKLREIIAYDGSQSVVSLGSLSGSEITLYDDCMACRREELEDGIFIETYYRFNPNIAMFLPVAETRYELDENGDAVNQEYYIYAVEGNWDQFEEDYAKSGMYPVWAGEWGDILTEDEYNEKISKGALFGDPVRSSVPDFEGF